MSESLYVDLFFIGRVVLLTGLLIGLPRVLRKGLLFGVYVGESAFESDPARRLRRQWDAGCLALAIGALAVGLTISALGWPVTGNLTGTVVLLLAALGFYIYVHGRARPLSSEDSNRQARFGVASLPSDPRNWQLALISLGACVLVNVASLGYAVASYLEMPDVLPSLFGSGTTNKSFIGVVFVASFSLILTTMLALLALLTAGAKQSLRDDPTSESIAAQSSFKSIYVRALSATALLYCLVMSILSFEIIRVLQGEIESLGIGLLVLLVALILFMGGCVVWILSRYGQGGARVERTSTNAHLTGAMADNSRWVLGLFYVDRSDPSIMIEKRFGFGYTMNYGNPIAIAITGVFAPLMVGLIIAGAIELAS